MSETLTIRASREEEARAVEVAYEFGSNLAEMVSTFGEELVFLAALRTVKNELRKVVRAKLKAEVPDQAIRDSVKAWRPRVRRPSSKVARFLKLVDRMSFQEKRDFLSQLKQA